MITLQAGEIFAENYKLVRFIDTGGFAEVWQAVFTNETVALKIFPKLNEEGVEKVKAEYAQSRLLHTHLIVPAYFGVYENRPYLVIKFCSGGNASRKIGECNEQEIAKCLYHVAGALAYLHQEEYVHQDIKPNNILLDDKGNYYLSDLGLSVRLRQTIRRFTQGINDQVNSRSTAASGITPTCYRAPELYNNPSVSKPPIQASDIWAVGATIFELASGDVPFGEWGGMVQVNTPEPPDLSGTFSPGLNKIVKKCLAKDPWDRPKASELEEWAIYYLKNGNWPAETATSTALALHTEPAINTIREKQSWQKIALILIFILVAAGGTWGIYKYTKNSSGQFVVDPDTTNTGIRYEKTQEGTLPLGEVVNITSKDSDSDGIPDDKDSCKNTPAGEKVDSKGCHSVAKPPTPIPKEPIAGQPRPSSEVVVTNFLNASTAPRNGNIRISRIERSPENIKVFFLLTKTPGEEDETFTIYGPQNKSNCWFINANGAEYNLISVYPSGKNLSFKLSHSLTISATFQKIPAYIKTITIVDGRDRDAIAQHDWTLKNVSIN